MEEIWKDVIGYENEYQVSCLGRVKSKDVSYKGKNGKKINRKGQIRALSLANKYLKVSLKKKSVEKTFNVHVLVGQAFIGIRNQNEQYDHIDGNNKNNAAQNLRIITGKQNMLRAVRGKSKYPGVWFRKANKNRPYVVNAQFNGLRKEYGSYATEEEAYAVYKNIVEQNEPNALKHFEHDMQLQLV